jgi:O-methyltransferase involved in polyketide biosynthesis
VFEVDQPGPQAWKRQRLIELGFGIPEWLRLVPVDFEAGGSWWEELAAAGFVPGPPAVVVLDDADRLGLHAAEKVARAARTPFISFYTPDEIQAPAREAGFKDAQHIAGHLLAERYFADRTDGLRP